MFGHPILFLYLSCVVVGIICGYVRSIISNLLSQNLFSFSVFITCAWTTNILSRAVYGRGSEANIQGLGSYTAFFIAYMLAFYFFGPGGDDWRRRFKKKASAALTKLIERVKEAARPVGGLQPVPTRG